MIRWLAGIGPLLVLVAVHQTAAQGSATSQRAGGQLMVGGPAVSNPAYKKCLDDGFGVEPVIVNGIPRDAECVDPKTGRRCRVWEYFRGECSLSVD